MLKSINPIFETLCIEKARALGTYIMNDASNIVLDSIDYKNIVSIEEVEGNKSYNTSLTDSDYIIYAIKCNIFRCFTIFKHFLTLVFNT